MKFRTDLTPFLKRGENWVEVRVDNRWNPSIAPRAGEHTFSGGLYRNVHLHVCSPVHLPAHGIWVQTPEVTPSRGKVRILAAVKNDSERIKRVTVRHTVREDKGGRVVLRGEEPVELGAGKEACVQTDLPPLAAPRLWSPAVPNMYRVTTELVGEGGKVLDRAENPLGFRTLELTADRGMLINGKPVYLQGANVHQDHAGWGDAVTDAGARRDVLLMNEGKLLYQGEPTALTQTMAGRSFLVSSPQENNRRLLQRALKLPQVSDGVIQGKSVRLILKKDARIEEVQQHGDMPPLQVADTAPRFEDAFIDLLGGAGTAESPLGAIIHRVDGSKEETVIEAQSLTKKFGDFAATDHVDFQVKRGEIFGLLGPNGAGKSTTFKMMCGLLVPTSGKALVLGMDLKVSSGKARQHLGYMAQKFSLYGNLSVEQNLRFFSGVYGLRGRAQNEKIARMSDAFGLKSIARHAADELPLGYKQRLALACSLMHEPDILFLDEPTSGVDPLTRREFWLHINSMVDKGVTVMVTTHFMDEAEYCDRIGLVYRGKLIAHGTPDDLKNQAADDAVPDPTMEQAFITLIHDWDKENAHAQ